MDCQKLTQIPVVQEAYSIPGSSVLDRIFICIYKLFKADFLKWVMKKFGSALDKNVSIELAKEAFQLGVIKFDSIAKEKRLEAKAKLGTFIFELGKWQFLALKKEKEREQKRTKIFTENDLEQYNYDKDSLIEEIIGSDEISWRKAIKPFISDEEFILHEAINMLPSAKWKRVIRLRYFFNKKPAEIGSEINVSKEDIHNTLSKARKALKEILITKFNFLKIRENAGINE